jgi:NAD(P)-dependent dehydrogenase (short-subunit alcohol dehydrogenase family)
METVLITGANRGIGLELASRYAAAGNRVLACCREPAKAEKLQALAKSRKGLTIHAVHVADAKSVAALAAEIRTAPVDILINNAGMPGPAPDKQSLANMDFDGWMETFAVNTMAPLRMLQTFRRNLKAGKNPRAITITSQMGALALNMPVMYAYCSSKAAVNKVMRMASLELASDGIAVGLIHPGWVKTDMGGANAEISVDDSAAGIMAVIGKLTLADTGSFKKWNGDDHAW